MGKRDAEISDLRAIVVRLDNAVGTMQTLNWPINDLVASLSRVEKQMAKAERATYDVTHQCDNCGCRNDIKVPKGVVYEDFMTKTGGTVIVPKHPCGHCGCELVLDQKAGRKGKE